MHQIGGAVVLLLCQQHLTVLLGNVGVGFLDRPLRVTDLRLRFLERGREVLRIHAGDDLAGLHQITLISQHLGDAAGVRRKLAYRGFTVDARAAYC